MATSHKYQKAVYDNLLDQIFYEERGRSMHLRYTLRDGEARLGFSEFVQNKNNEWVPGTRHFFMSLNGWMEMVKAMEPFNEQVMQGTKNRFVSYILPLRPFYFSIIFI
jgi:hypothetical protein